MLSTGSRPSFKNRVSTLQRLKASTCVGDLHDLGAELQGCLISLGRVAITVAGEPHKTSPALGQMMYSNHLSNRLALDLLG